MRVSSIILLTLYLMDVSMPVMDGLTATKAKLKGTNNIPIIAFWKTL